MKLIFRSDDPRRRAAKKLAWAAATTSLLAGLEFAGGIVSHSLALISDAGHMMVDLFAIGLSLFSIVWSTKTPSEQKTYGYSRLEILATLANGALLLFIAFEIVWSAFSRWQNPITPDIGVMIPIALAGLVGNLIAALLLRGEHDHHATHSAFLHVLADTVSSIGVVTAALLIRWTGYSRIDPAISFGIALMILFGAYRLLKEAVDILLEASPAHIPLDNVRESILSVSGVEGVHDLHVWTISSGFQAASAHLMVKNMSVSESERLISEVSLRLREGYAITHTTFQVGSPPPPARIAPIPSHS